MRLIRAAGLALLLLGLAAWLAVGGRRFRRGTLRTASRILLRLLHVRVHASGPLVSPPFVLVTNHLGYLDILVLASLAPAVFVAKAEVRSWPLLGPICRDLGTVFVDREDRHDLPRVLAVLEEALEAGDGVVFFPEGTSSPGDTVLPFRSSLLALAARLGRPVHHATLHYRTAGGDPPARQAVCWWGDTDFFPHLWGLLGLRGVEATVGFGAEPIQEGDRKVLAARLRAAVEERLTAAAQSLEKACHPAAP